MGSRGKRLVAPRVSGRFPLRANVPNRLSDHRHHRATIGPFRIRFKSAS